MEKIKFNNEMYYWSVILLLSGLSIWNLIIVLQGSLIGLLPMLMQAAIITLFVLRNKHALIAVKIWSIVFVASAGGLQLIGRLMNDSLDSFVAFDLAYYVKAIVELTVGLGVFFYAKKTMQIVTAEN